MRTVYWLIVLGGVVGCFSPKDPEITPDLGTSGTDPNPGSSGVQTPETAPSGTATTTGTGPEPGTDPTQVSTSSATETTGPVGPGPTTGGESSSDSGSGSDSESTAATAPTRVVVFRAPMTNGDLRTAGGEGTARASADAYCEDAPLFPDGCTSVHAFLSVSAGDEIRDMVDNYGVPDDLPIESAGGTLIDDDFDALLDGSLQVSLRDAGVFAGDELFWTGSNADGSETGIDCAGWTASMGGGPDGAGTAGTSDSTTFWSTSVSALCSNSLRFACVCW